MQIESPHLISVIASIGAYCKQFLLYGMEAVNLCNNKLNTIDYTYMYMYMYSNAICKIFNAVLKTFCILGIGDCWMSREVYSVD